ncbi:hypothetical protein Patl1_30039 [Pistacia atlantica]|uniref:Uncharacterized protein n=1 Tax=Pistacia atlantica TaxID=434234 RepID=A0ACC1AE33_9ROSI|nr:hypothetical protein Patl1_30039 [Pistacia atlantica]
MTLFNLKIMQFSLHIKCVTWGHGVNHLNTTSLETRIIREANKSCLKVKHPC